MAGIWYRGGTATVTNGSKKVTGFGTQWQTSTWKVEKGHAWYGPDGKPYEIDYVESDTVLYLVTAYGGPTAASQSYAIDITRTGTIPAFSRQLSAQLAYAQGQFDSWQQILTGADMVTLTAPDGQQVQVPSLSAFQPTSASLKALQALSPVKDKIPVFNGPAGAELITLTAFTRTLLDDNSASEALGTLGVSDFVKTLLDDVNAAAALSTLDIADLYKKRNILGPVSQSGGVPTGAIIESGSNANGRWAKYASGDAIVTIRVQSDRSFVASVVANLVIAAYVLPSPVPLISGSCAFSGYDSVGAGFGIAYVSDANTVQVVQYGVGAAGTRSAEAYIIVAGRWF